MLIKLYEMHEKCSLYINKKVKNNFLKMNSWVSLKKNTVFYFVEHLGTFASKHKQIIFISFFPFGLEIYQLHKGNCIVF